MNELWKYITNLLASGASRRPWVLGKVMEKEYCQAKKVRVNPVIVHLGVLVYGNSY